LQADTSTCLLLAESAEYFQISHKPLPQKELQDFWKYSTGSASNGQKEHFAPSMARSGHDWSRHYDYFYTERFIRYLSLGIAYGPY